MGKPKTIRVRIAVAVDASGGWIADGCCVTREEARAREARRWLGQDGGPVAVHWVVAEIPLPQVGEVAGTVEPAGGTDAEA